jgi:hypothetical protein
MEALERYFVVKNSVFINGPSPTPIDVDAFAAASQHHALAAALRESSSER